jgi:carboxypeptidase Taq
MGFHECQSRFVENFVGRSRGFWRYFFPKFCECTKNRFDDVELDAFIRAINKVKFSKIRVEADEVTYNLHIIIRSTLEKELFSEKITVAELPEKWNKLYEDYLQVTVKDDAEGVMQDIHWASGLFGYFPSYTLGNLYSGQIVHKLNGDFIDWREKIAQGSFCEVKNWLIQNVYKLGNLYDPLELIKKITGHELSPQPYLTYLNTKYSQLYEI